jgi:hypothetical protein
MPWAGDRIDAVFKRKFPLEERGLDSHHREDGEDDRAYA